VLERHGPWDRVYDLFRRWQRGHLGEDPHQLRAEADVKGLITCDVNIDSTVRRAHQHAARAAKGGTGDGGEVSVFSDGKACLVSLSSVTPIISRW
jgi:hypothetical protein